MHGAPATASERAGWRNSEASVVGDTRFSLMIQSVQAPFRSAHRWLDRHDKPYSTGTVKL
jgi:hypothetical protein